MAKITDPSKLLPSKISSSLVKVRSGFNKPTVRISKKTSSLSKILLGDRQSKDTDDINNKLVKVEKFLKSDFLSSQKKAEEKRKQKEKKDFDEAEKKLETPKFGGIKFPKLPSPPSLGFLDRVKRFLFFTALGWALPKILEFLPKLQGFVKIIGGVYQFAEGLFGKLFDGFMSLVKFGGDLKDKTLGFIATAKAGVGENYQKEFDKLEKQFNTFVNASIIAGVLSADIGLSVVSELNRLKKERGTSEARGKLGTGLAGRFAREPSKKPYGAGSAMSPGRYRKPGQAAAGGFELEQARKAATAAKTAEPSKPPSWWNRIFKGPFAKLKGPLTRFAGVAVPGLGAAVGAADAAARFKAGDKIGGTLASISATLDGLTAVSALTGIGLPIAGIFGIASIGIDVVLLIRDILSIIPGIPKNLLGFSSGGRVVSKYQGGGTARGGRQVSARRTIMPARKKPIKMKPPKSQPGKSVGGEKRIKEFYSEKIDQNHPDYYKALPLSQILSSVGRGGVVDKRSFEQYEALTKTAKILKDIPLIGGLVAGGVDVALGQALDVRKAVGQFSSGISYLVESLANQRVNASMSSLMNDIKGFAEGGYVPTSRQLKGDRNLPDTASLISKVLGPTIDQRVNEAIQNIQKELQKKQKRGSGQRPGGGPGDDGSEGSVVESIDMTGLRPEDVDALGRMIQAESRGESNVGKAAVMNVILNRYRLARSGEGYIPSGKTKDNVTIRDILYAPNQFTPVSNGSFDRISSDSGKSALAKAIAAGGNDPVKLKQELIKSGLSEEDANLVIVSTAFSNPRLRRSTPYDTRQVNVENHAFQESPNARLRAPGQRIDANVKIIEAMVTGGIKPSDIPLTSGQGWRRGRMHNGIDLDGGDGSPISSAQDAKVIWAGDKGDDYGNSVVLRYSNGAETRFAHLMTIGVREGQSIKAGQLIGKQGNTGSSTASHLHFEYFPNGGAMNYSGHGDAFSVKDSYFRYGGNVQPRIPNRPLDNPPQRQSSGRMTPEQVRQLQSQIGRLKPGDKPVVVPGIGSIEVKRGGFLGLGDPERVYRNADNKVITQKQFNDLMRKYRLPSANADPNTGYGELSGGKGQGGGLIGPSIANRSVPNSFTSYNHPNSRVVIAIQPIQTIVDRPVPTSSGSNSMIAFPIIVGVNNSNDLDRA